MNPSDSDSEELLYDVSGPKKTPNPRYPKLHFSRESESSEEEPSREIEEE